MKKRERERERERERKCKDFTSLLSDSSIILPLTKE